MKDLVVLILAAGKSERFWPLGDKNLLSFFGQRLIEYQVDLLKKSGFPKIGIVGNKENIAEFKKIKDVEVFLQEGKGQGAAILAAIRFIKGKSVLVVNADDIVEQKVYEDFRKWIYSSNIDGVFCGYEIKRYLPLGYYIVNKEGFVTGVVEKPKEGEEPSNLARIVIDYYRDSEKLIFYLEQFLKKNECFYELAIEAMLKKGLKFKMVKYDGYWGILKYPWQTLDLGEYFLKGIKEVRIGKNVRIDKSSFFSGKVVIGDNVKIMENVKIVGPCFIGENTIVGNNCLIRESIIGKNCVVGFSSDITRSYIGNFCWLHTNYIGDSVVSDNVSFGSGAVTANFRLDEGEIKSLVKGEKINTYKLKLGAMIGKNVRIGVNTSVMPGVKIGSNSFIGAGLLIDNDIPDNTFCYGKTQLIIKKNKFKIDEKKREELKKKLTI